VLWAFSNLVFTGLILVCLFRLLPRTTSATTKVVLSALFLAGTPWRNGLGNGQHALFTLAFFLLSVVMFSRNPKGATVALAISWFKYTISLPLSLFYARTTRGWVTILGSALIHAALTLFSAAWVHTSPVDMFSGPVRVARFSPGIGYLDVFAIASALSVSSRWLPALVAACLLVVTYAAIRRDPDALSSISTLSLATMTVVYHSGYDFVVLVVPLAYALRERPMTARARCYLLVVALIWFVDKIVLVISDHAHAASLDPYLHAYFWFKVAVFYGALCADWLTACKIRVRMAPTAVLG